MLFIEELCSKTRNFCGLICRNKFAIFLNEGKNMPCKKVANILQKGCGFCSTAIYIVGRPSVYYDLSPLYTLLSVRLLVSSLHLMSIIISSIHAFCLSVGLFFRSSVYYNLSPLYTLLSVCLLVCSLHLLSIEYYYLLYVFVCPSVLFGQPVCISSSNQNQLIDIVG